MNVDSRVKPAISDSTVKRTSRPRRAFRALVGQRRTERLDDPVQRRQPEDVEWRQHGHPDGAEAGHHGVGDGGAAGDHAGQHEPSGRRGAELRDVGQEAGRQEDEEGAGEEQQLRPERRRPHEAASWSSTGPGHGAESSSPDPQSGPRPHPSTAASRKRTPQPRAIAHAAGISGENRRRRWPVSGSALALMLPPVW